MGFDDALARVGDMAGDKTVDVDLRRRATELIGETGARTMVPLLCGLLDDDALFHNRQYAAKALMQVADERATPAILKRLEDFGTDPLTLCYCMRALARVRPRRARATQALCRLLQEHPHYGVRSGAACALGQYDGPVAEQALIGALSDPDSAVRRAAATALGKCRRTELSKAALEAAFHDDVEAVRLAAKRAIDAQSKLGP